MKTIVDVIRECLDKGITNKYDIAIELREAFPNDDIYKIQKRINSTITYINKKKVIKSEFDIQGAPVKLEHQDKLIKYLRLIKEKTDLKFCKFIWVTGRKCYYRPYNHYYLKNSHFIRISSNSWAIRSEIDNDFLGVVLHELVHANGFSGHGKDFYNKLTSVSIKSGLNLSKWFNKEYEYGKQYYLNNVRPKINKELLNEWEKI